MSAARNRSLPLQTEKKRIRIEAGPSTKRGEVGWQTSPQSRGILGHLPPWPRNALNNSVIGMEQAYRQRKGLTMLSDADIEALKAGQPMSWESGGGASASAAASPAPPAAAAPTAAPPAAAPAATASAGNGA